MTSYWRISIPRRQDYLIAALLCLLISLAFYFRYLMFAYLGGFADDYLAWAEKNFFGGISELHWRMAGVIVEGDFLGLTTIYPPGYAFFLAVFRYAGFSPQDVRLFQGLLDACGAGLVYLVVVRLGVSRWLGLLAAAVFAIAPWWLFGSVTLLPEALLPVLVLAVMVLIRGAEHSRNSWPWLLLGLLAGLAPLFRPEMILLGGAVFVWALVAAPAHFRLRSAALVLSTFLVFPLMWASFNWLVHGQFLMTSNVKWYNLWAGLGELPNAHGYFANDGLAAELLQRIGLQPLTPEAEQYWRVEYLRAWRDHPGYVLATIANRIRLILFSFDHMVIRTAFKPIFALYSLGPYLLGTAIVVSLARRRWSDVVWIAGPLAYAIVSVGLVHVEPRYIRYASLSYLLSATVLVQFLLNMLTSIAPRFMRPVISTVVCAVLSGAVLMMTISGGGQLISQATAALADMAVRTDRPERNLDLSGIAWTPAVADVEYHLAADRRLVLKTTLGTTEYQLKAPLSFDDRAHVLLVRVRANLIHGGIGLGVLRKNEKQWLGMLYIGTQGEQGYEMIALLEEPRAILVLANQRTSAGRSEVVVESLEGVLLCPSKLAGIAAHIPARLLPRPLVPCR
jgi:4-amino-4-deoxy-L-arabinose transferase-like glycosyltransferase